MSFADKIEANVFDSLGYEMRGRDQDVSTFPVKVVADKENSWLSGVQRRVFIREINGTRPPTDIMHFGRREIVSSQCLLSCPVRHAKDAMRIAVDLVLIDVEAQSRTKRFRARNIAFVYGR